LRQKKSTEEIGEDQEDVFPKCNAEGKVRKLLRVASERADKKGDILNS